MKFVICDDTAEDIAFLKENLKKYYGELPGKLLISHSGEELLAGEEYEGFDLLFLDVYMKELDGIETARRLRQRGEEGKIILLTTGREFGPQSYEVGAAWYLVKPLRYEELARALEQCGRLEEKEELTLQVHVRKDQFTIPVSKIHYIETEGRQVLIHMSGKELKVYDTMERLYGQLPEEEFIRPHRSYILCLGYIERLDGDQFLLKNGERVSINRAQRRQIREAYQNYLFRTLENVRKDSYE